MFFRVSVDRCLSDLILIVGQDSNIYFQATSVAKFLGFSSPSRRVSRIRLHDVIPSWFHASVYNYRLLTFEQTLDVIAKRENHVKGYSPSLLKQLFDEGVCDLQKLTVTTLKPQVILVVISSERRYPV